jgi:hypothetical protein
MIGPLSLLWLCSLTEEIHALLDGVDNTFDEVEVFRN